MIPFHRGPPGVPLPAPSSSSSTTHPARPGPTPFSRPQPSSTAPLLFTSSSGEAERFTPCGWDSLAALIVPGDPDGKWRTHFALLILSRGARQAGFAAATGPEQHQLQYVRSAPPGLLRHCRQRRAAARLLKHSGSCSFVRFARAVLNKGEEKGTGLQFPGSSAARRARDGGSALGGSALGPLRAGVWQRALQPSAGPAVRGFHGLLFNRSEMLALDKCILRS